MDTEIQSKGVIQKYDIQNGVAHYCLFYLMYRLWKNILSTAIFKSLMRINSLQVETYNQYCIFMVLMILSSL